MRQGPCLFTLLLANLEEELEKGGGVRLGRGNIGRQEGIYALAYADDLANLAKDEEGTKGVMRKLESYLDKEGLDLNIQKTKVIRYRKGGRRWKKVSCRWKGGVVGEVREYKYLRYVVKYNGKQEAHKRESEEGSGAFGEGMGYREK